MLDSIITEAIEQSVLCWLATLSSDGFPNVSPKEAFTCDANGRLLIAHIASPQSIRNIQANPNVCVSFVNIFTQKGYKIKGTATMLKPGHADWESALGKLTDKIGTSYPIHGIISLRPKQTEPIIAPSYRLFPDTTETDRIADSLQTYRVADYQSRAIQGK
ncbi:MAG: pyridoxamine 5'-phosphate oxidase family protein [Puniceicoccaceae bacterium]